jgi:hypothetical protein
MASHVEILRSGRKDSAITEDEIETILAGQFGFRIERDMRGGIAQARKKTASGEKVLVYDPPSALWMENPDRDALQLMIEIAGALRHGARVRNDEYQTYLTVDQTYTHPHDAEHFHLKASPTPLKAVNWREQLASAPKVILLLVLCYIAGKMLLAHLARH